MRWRNLLAVLTEAEMGVENFAKVTIYLSDRKYREANEQIRAEVIGNQRASVDHHH